MKLAPEMSKDEAMAALHHVIRLSGNAIREKAPDGTMAYLREHEKALLSFLHANAERDALKAAVGRLTGAGDALASYATAAGGDMCMVHGPDNTRDKCPGCDRARVIADWSAAKEAP